MNNDLISRSALLELAHNHVGGVVDCNDIARFPAVDAVSPGVLEQYKWERDAAIAQLEELGIGFGQKKPDIQVVRHGRWIMRGGKFRCSECDAVALQKDEGGTGGFSHEYVYVKSNHCHHCGANMRGVVDGEEKAD